MGRLTTHVLDAAHGRPASGVAIALRRNGQALGAFVTNHDGRCDAPLLEGAAMAPGVYELDFAVGDYFALPPPRFLDVVTVRFGLSGAEDHVHVPLLVTPWSYSTYRGS